MSSIQSSIHFKIVINWRENGAVCCADTAARDICEAVQLCVPVVDSLLANTHYGVLSFSQPDLSEICS